MTAKKATAEQIEQCLKKVQNASPKTPEAGYDLRSLKVHFNATGEPYPYYTYLGHYRTWEEARDAAAKAANEEVGKERADRIFILPFEKRSYGEPPERSVIEKILDDIDFHTPEKGYNLCYADTFEEFGEQLCTIGHYETYDEALEAGSEGYYFYICPAKRKREVEPQ